MNHEQRAKLRSRAQTSNDQWLGACKLLNQLAEQKQLSPLQIQAVEAVVEDFKKESDRDWSAYMATFNGYGLVAEVQVVVPRLLARHRRYMRAIVKHRTTRGVASRHLLMPGALLV